jgi:sulfur-oxidizing protein SoxY
MTKPARAPAMQRRDLLGWGLAAGAGLCLCVRPAGAQAPAPGLQMAIRAYAGDAPVQVGKVHLEVAPLVENGNAVPISVTVDSPMTEAEHVVGIAVFNERNPQRDVARFALGPLAGRAAVSTRIRLATSQQLVAIARLSDGSCWSHSVDVLVTLAACIE